MTTRDVKLRHPQRRRHHTGVDPSWAVGVQDNIVGGTNNTSAPSTSPTKPPVASSSKPSSSTACPLAPSATPIFTPNPSAMAAPSARQSLRPSHIPIRCRLLRFTSFLRLAISNGTYVIFQNKQMVTLKDPNDPPHPRRHRAPR